MRPFYTIRSSDVGKGIVKIPDGKVIYVHSLGLPYYISGTVGKQTFIQELNKDEDNYIGAIEGKQKAEYIVHCVNTHQALIGALEAIANQATSESNGHDKLNQLAEIAQEALKQAKEREA